MRSRAVQSIVPQEILFLCLLILIPGFHATLDGGLLEVRIQTKTQGQCTSNLPSMALQTDSPEAIDMWIGNWQDCDPMNTAVVTYTCTSHLTRADHTVVVGTSGGGGSCSSGTYLTAGSPVPNPYCPNSALPWANSWGVTLTAQANCNTGCCSGSASCRSELHNVSFRVRVPDLVCAPQFTRSLQLTAPVDGVVVSPGSKLLLYWESHPVVLSICPCKNLTLYYGTQLSFPFGNAITLPSCSVLQWELGALPSNTPERPWYYWTVAITPWNIDNPSDTSTAQATYRQFCVRGVPDTPVLLSPKKGDLFYVGQTITFQWAPLANWGFSCGDPGSTPHFLLFIGSLGFTIPSNELGYAWKANGLPGPLTWQIVAQNGLTSSSLGQQIQLSCTLNCTDCSSVSSGQCDVCELGFGRDNNGTKCTKCPTGSFSSNGTVPCQPCSSGVGGKKCVECGAITGNCTLCSSSTDFFIVNGRCTQQYQLVLDLPANSTVNITELASEISNVLGVVSSDVVVIIQTVDPNGRVVVVVTLLNPTTVDSDGALDAMKKDQGNKWLRYAVSLTQKTTGNQLNGSVGHSVSFYSLVVVVLLSFLSLFTQQ